MRFRLTVAAAMLLSLRAVCAQTTMRILALETSCDETAVAVVDDGQHVRSSIIASQIELHAPYGGVVPEVACRAHAEWLAPMIPKAMADAGATWSSIDAIAVTSRPGLIGALLVGLSAGKALAWANDKPLVAVDHIAGHIHAPRMAHEDIPWPHLALVVSGGHTEVYLCPDEFETKVVAATADDAAGECFDKVAALLGLGYPGGPSIERTAKAGNPKAFHFSRGRPGEEGLALSFSGLKTALLYHLRDHGVASKAGRPRLSKGHQGRGMESVEEGGVALPSAQWIADTAASFQEAAVDMLVRVAMSSADATGVRAVTLTGGVACNTRLREKLLAAGDDLGVQVFLTPKHLCTDNAAMIAGAAYPFARDGRFDGLDVEAVPN